MNTLYGATATMCYACTPALPTLKMVPGPGRPEPTGPQYFTFDPLPEAGESPAPRNLSKSNRIKKRSRRVLYPRVVKRYYPAEERSYVKHLFVILLTIIFFQVYSAEEEFAALDASQNAEENVSVCSTEMRGSEEENLLEQLIVASVEIEEAANSTGWDWGDWEAAESAIDITQFLEQRPAAF
ncbi:radiation-inducible immediate-early gene IEX-1 [Podarcis raffonei]|uniref:radiation-inducible immediate-early gene IEX-1 n=1 Tax=Podarcis raffonei TaxID=65483 RepID=UPI0023294B33|nr:radiation-inducible immediate-early gene IEX-1 [Podarcis raffonei]